MPLRAHYQRRRLPRLALFRTVPAGQRSVVGGCRIGPGDGDARYCVSAGRADNSSTRIWLCFAGHPLSPARHFAIRASRPSLFLLQTSNFTLPSVGFVSHGTDPRPRDTAPRRRLRSGSDATVFRPHPQKSHSEWSRRGSIEVSRCPDPVGLAQSPPAGHLSLGCCSDTWFASAVARRLCVVVRFSVVRM